jgi:hypothetical protein
MTSAPDGLPEPSSQASLEDRADELAQRFSKSDWIELGAAILLALATIMAAWSAYQSTRWSGVQANAYSSAAARRTEATQATNIYAAQVQIDVQTWLTWLEQKSSGNDSGADFLYSRFREEFRPAFDAWRAVVPEGEIPPGTPFDLDEYQPAQETRAQELNSEADAFGQEAREANQRGDNFVLAAVIMASVLFFAGVGTKFRGRRVRISMLVMAVLLFLGGVAFIFSMPQNVGL